MRHGATEVTQIKRHGMCNRWRVCVCVCVYRTVCMCRYGNSGSEVTCVHADNYANTMQCVLRQGGRLQQYLEASM